MRVDWKHRILKLYTLFCLVYKNLEYHNVKLLKLVHIEECQVNLQKPHLQQRYPYYSTYRTSLIVYKYMQNLSVIFAALSIIPIQLMKSKFNKVLLKFKTLSGVFPLLSLKIYQMQLKLSRLLRKKINNNE